MRCAIVAAVIAAVLVPCSSALADDFAAPSYRDKPLSYMVEWDLNNPGPGPLPQLPTSESWVDDANPATFLYDKFSSHIDYNDPNKWVYNQEGSITSIAPEGDSLACNIINWVDDELEKLLRVQVTYSGQTPTVMQLLGFDGFYHDPPRSFESTFAGHVTVDATHFYEDWVIHPNPEWEQLAIFAPYGTTIDQIVVDTISPEPTSLALLAFGGLALLCHRGRGRR